MDNSHDDQLTRLEADGIPPLPPAGDSGVVVSEGAKLWYASWGAGPTLLLLHGGLGNAGNWGHQVSAFVAAGYRVIVMDTRGHGRSSRDERPFSYWLLARDAIAVLDHLKIASVSIVGWSDGADTGLVLASIRPEMVTALVFFACNVDPSGTLPFQMTPAIGRIFARHVADYRALSPAPDGFDALQEAVSLMQANEPNLSAADLAAIEVPVLSLIGEHDEFISEAHARAIADGIPGAAFQRLDDVSHFAPLQRPAAFNAAVIDFLKRHTTRRSA